MEFITTEALSHQKQEKFLMAQESYLSPWGLVPY
jgi:hypothetical protein